MARRPAGGWSPALGGPAGPSAGGGGSAPAGPALLARPRLRRAQYWGAGPPEARRPPSTGAGGGAFGPGSGDYRRLHSGCGPRVGALRRRNPFGGEPPAVAGPGGLDRGSLADPAFGATLSWRRSSPRPAPMPKALPCGTRRARRIWAALLPQTSFRPAGPLGGPPAGQVYWLGGRGGGRQTGHGPTTQAIGHVGDRVRRNRSAELAPRSAWRRRLGLPLESTVAQSRLTGWLVTFMQRTPCSPPNLTDVLEDSSDGLNKTGGRSIARSPSASSLASPAMVGRPAPPAASWPSPPGANRSGLQAREAAERALAPRPRRRKGFPPLVPVLPGALPLPPRAVGRGPMPSAAMTTAQTARSQRASRAEGAQLLRSALIARHQVSGWLAWLPIGRIPVATPARWTAKRSKKSAGAP